MESTPRRTTAFIIYIHSLVVVAQMESTFGNLGALVYTPEIEGSLYAI